MNLDALEAQAQEAQAIVAERWSIEHFPLTAEEQVEFYNRPMFLDVMVAWQKVYDAAAAVLKAAPELITLARRVEAMEQEHYRAWQRAAEAPTVYSEPLPSGCAHNALRAEAAEERAAALGEELLACNTRWQSIHDEMLRSRDAAERRADELASKVVAYDDALVRAVAAERTATTYREALALYARFDKWGHNERGTAVFLDGCAHRIAQRALASIDSTGGET